jgi:myo-inositol-1(or 4)-monophosphatase
MTISIAEGGRSWPASSMMHDYVASVLLVEEAGGQVSAFSGGPVTANGDILASNSAIHPWLVQGFN